MSQFATLMSEFGKTAGLGELKPNAENECVLEIDNFIVTLFSNDEEYLTVYASVGKLGKNNREAVMSRLLAGNYFFSETAGATLGVSPYDGDIQLIYSERMQGLAVNALTVLLENYLKRLEYWSAVCREEVNETPKAAATPPKMPFDGIRG